MLRVPFNLYITIRTMHSVCIVFISTALSSLYVFIHFCDISCQWMFCKVYEVDILIYLRRPVKKRALLFRLYYKYTFLHTFENSVKLEKYRTVWMLARADKRKLPHTPWSGLSALGCGGRSSEVAFIYTLHTSKKQRSLAGSVINCQGGLEVAAVKSELCM